MSADARPRQRRRNVLTCLECRKRKQKCDRGHPCVQCVVRGTESICSYEKFKSSAAVIARGSIYAKEPSSVETAISRAEGPEGPSVLRRAHDYGYSNSDSLNSMGMLKQVITGIDANIQSSHPVVVSQMQSKIRTEYYGYVRRLPPRMYCEILFQSFFGDINHINSALDEGIFRDQEERWWSSAHDVLLTQGPEKLPEDLRLFPALIFQILAVTLQFVPPTYNTRLDELKFGPFQSFIELSREYTDCGLGLSKSLGKARATFVGVQYSFMRDVWLINKGDLTQAWNHSGQSVKDAMAIGLHLEPELPSSSKPEALLDALWMNELRKRTWLNLFVWDSSMAIALGRPMFIDLKECTVTLPIDCDIPSDRLKRVPVARSDPDKPTPMTERLLRYKLSQRFQEIRELEGQGSIPRDPDKVKKLHHFAVDWLKSLPACYRKTKPDTRWDLECPFVPLHRELLSYLFDHFLMALHRPYIFTREKSQRQVYERALAILDSQDRLFDVLNKSSSQFYIGLTFPTFDAGVLLAVVLVSNPERYHELFPRPYQSLKNAVRRLNVVGSVMPLAKTGGEILQTTLRRVVESQERAGFKVYDQLSEVAPIEANITPKHEEVQSAGSVTSASLSPDAEPWQFEVNQSTMNWTVQNLDVPEFDFSNLEVPMPLKELLLDEELAILPDAGAYDPAMWAQDQQGAANLALAQQQIMDLGENTLWNFLTDYPEMSGDPNTL